ncbi:hypothetical protein GOBAR_DD31076 [Gossypium barbadense]|nr:hypothetical protein GOBAR_DD31076 [Gossypium barbadense]
MGDTQCPDFSFHFRNIRHHLLTELMNRLKVAVGDLGFVFALNVIQHHRSGVTKFFSKAPVLLVDVHGRLVGEMGGLGCRMSLVVRPGCLEDGRPNWVAHEAGRLRRSELGYGFF